MSSSEHCSVKDCDQAAAASLDGDEFCVAHFISSCYTRLDDYNRAREGSGLSVTDAESARHFIHECTRHADQIENAAHDLDNLSRAKLLHVIISASELGRHLRRSPRKAASITVHLSSDKLGGAWEEDAQTVLLSRYGASVRCAHTAKPGETIQVMRPDTGQRANARVAWLRGLGSDDLRIGVEFVGCENFWGLDWAAVEEAR